MDRLNGAVDVEREGKAEWKDEGVDVELDEAG